MSQGHATALQPEQQRDSVSKKKKGRNKSKIQWKLKLIFFTFVKEEALQETVIKLKIMKYSLKQETNNEKE